MDYRHAIITGASSGIGRSLAYGLADRGVTVVVAGRRLALLEEVVAQITARGGRAIAAALDVTDPDQTTATLRRLDDELDGIDLVIANAGVGGGGWSGQLTWASCAPTIAVNVSGAVASLVALMDRMVERRRGHLVGISSIAQYRGLPRSAVYSASKAFLSTFLEGLRVDLRSSGVHVTDVRPGYVRTAMTDGQRRPMPFIIDADVAAERILTGIVARDPVLAFPWQLAVAMRSARLLPAGLYDRVVSRAGR